jgi:hypothetical protein
LQWILHGWGDDECIQILKNCLEAISEDKGKVIIVEAVIEEAKMDKQISDARLMLDMAMMAHTNAGKEIKRPSRSGNFFFGRLDLQDTTSNPFMLCNLLLRHFSKLCTI